MRVNYAWIFDVDGVIMNPETKEANARLLSEIVKKLHNKEPVVLITGRSLEWLEERVLNQLFSLIKHPDDEQMFYVSGEFGGAYMRYKNRKMTSFIDNAIAAPQTLLKEVVKIVDSEFSDIVFLDTTKKTMVSIEMKQGATVSQFKKRRQALDQKLQEIVNKLDLRQNFVIHSDRIATNIRDIHASKHYSVEQLLEWFKEDKIKPENFLVFGDSLGDLEMGLELQKANQPFKFIFVGGEEELRGLQITFPVIHTKAHCEEGTLEYLTSVQT